MRFQSECRKNTQRKWRKKTMPISGFTCSGVIQIVQITEGRKQMNERKKNNTNHTNESNCMLISCRRQHWIDNWCRVSLKRPLFVIEADAFHIFGSGSILQWIFFHRKDVNQSDHEVCSDNLTRIIGLI